MWSIILNYTPYHTNSIYYELLVIPVLILILVMRLAQFLKSRTNKSSSSGIKDEETPKIKKLESNQGLTTAQIAAKAEKAKLEQINERNKRNERSVEFKTPELSKESPETPVKISSMPRPTHNKKHTSKSASESTPKITSESVENNIDAQKSKPKWAFKSQKTSPTSQPAPEKIEIIKIRKSSKDLVVILSLIILSALFIFLPTLKTSLIKIPFIIMLIFFIPGYSVLSGIFVNFADHGLFKKLVSSVLLSITLVIGLLLAITLLKLQLSSDYILAALLVISTLMSVLGYLRRSRSQKKLKHEFKERAGNSEKSELNVLTVSQARETKDYIFKSNSEQSLILENKDHKPLQNRNIILSKNSEEKSSLEELSTTSSTINENKNENKNKDEIGYVDSKNINSNSVITPADARKRVMSRKKARENLQKENKKIKSSKVNSIQSHSEIKFNNENNVKNVKKSGEYSKGLSLFKLIIVIVLSVIGLFLTITSINSLIPSTSGTLLNSELIKLIFIIPILLYLPGYAMKELFIPRKYSGIVFTTAICVVVSLSLDIILAFALLYIGDLFNQINITQSLYVGILSFISVSGILIGYWQSNYRNKDKIIVDEITVDGKSSNVSKVVYSFQESPKKDKERYKEKEIKSTANVSKYQQMDQKNIEDSEKLTSLNENKKVAPEEVASDKNQTWIIPENKSTNISHGKKPLKTLYMEEELEKSFPSSDYFKASGSNNSEYISSKSPDLTPKKRFIAMDLLIILIISFLTIISIYIPTISKTPINEILGLLFVLFIPGYVLISALFPKRHDLDNIERLALSFGLSLVISTLIGMTLNYTPFGTKLSPIVIALTGFTLIMLIVAYLQRRKVAEDDRFQPNFSGYLYSLKSSFNKESKLDKLLSIILILTLVLAIATTAYIIVKPKEGEKFTEFYILGPNGKASDYPTNLTMGQTGKLFMGVVNHEYSTMNYEVVVKLQGKVLSTEKLTLKNNQKWEKTVTFTPDQSGSKQKLEFILYKLPDNKKPYRSLHLWVNVV